MSATASNIFRFLAFPSLVVMGSVSLAIAQVVPNPPTLVTVEDAQNSRGNPLFFDDFNYLVDRVDPGGVGNTAGSAWRAFTSRGWSAVKRNPTDPNAAGYLYTTSSIPGYSGQMPGLSGSGRVLCLEAKPTSIGLANTGNNQSDFYLQYGRPNSTDVPANIWYQFWFYVLDQPGYASRFADGNKLIYPSPNGSYGVPTGMLPYLLVLDTRSNETTGAAWNFLNYGSSVYLVNNPQYNSGAATGADFRNASEYPTNRDKSGTNLNRAGGYLTANRWYLVKIHIDHSGPQGAYEMWHRQLGGSWQKTTEWIGGVTPNFQFPTIPAQRAGISTIRMPTTFGKANSTTTNYDSWMYMADFAMARRETDLPTYGDY